MLHVAEAKLTPVELSGMPVSLGDFVRSWLRHLHRQQVGATGTAMTNFLENELLDHILSNATYTGPATTFVALYTADPGETFAGTEVTGGSYARVSYTNNVANWPAASGGSKSNANVIDFGTATANWGTITHVALADASSAGNGLFYGALTASKTVNNGDGFKFLATKLVVAFD